MKNTFKKVIALLLCLMIFLPVAAIQAFAAETSDTSSATSSETTSSGTTSSGTTSAGKDESGADEDIWKKLKPAYMSTGFTSVDDRINGNDVIAPMTCMLIKDGFAIYADTLTGEVVLLKLSKPNSNNEYEKKENGVYKYEGYFTTNPYNIGTATVGGKALAEAVKEPLYAQIELKYLSIDNTESTLNSFKDAAINDQIKVKEIRNGIRVEYTLGREEIKYLVPRRIKKEKLEAIEAQIKANSPSSRDAKQFMSFYGLKDPNADEPRKTIEEMKKAFPICTKFPIYVCEPAITARELLRLENFIKKYTNYSFDQLDIDHGETEYVATDKAPPLFKLALEYTIDEFGFAVRCNAGNIRFDTQAYKLSNITVLPFAGAGDTSKKGYILTPDGSGTLFRFEDVKSQDFTTSNQLYGPDYAFHNITGSNKLNMYLPVFGVVQSYKDFDEEDTPETEVPSTDVSGETSEGTESSDVSGETSEGTTPPQNKVENINTGYFAVIEDGESLANISVSNGGARHSYISVRTTFNPRPKDKYELTGGISASANTTWTVESKRKYTGDLKLRFFILTEDVTYGGMAKLYRDYLVRKGVLTELKQTENSDIPLYLETLGALESTKEVLGVPVTTMVALTTFKDNIEMLKNLSQISQIKNINLKLTGWANGGMFPTVPNGVEIEKVLGGEKDFKELIKYASENGFTVFPDFDLAYAYTDKSFDGFKATKDLAQTIDEKPTVKKAYNPITQAFQRTGIGIVSPTVMDRFYTNTYKDYSSYNVGAISLSSLGNTLASDFNPDDTLHREDSKTLITKLLAKVKENNGKVLLSGGNEYTLPYATDIIDVPLDDSSYKYSSASVPFMSMVLHGYVDYAGTAINLAGDYKFAFLKTIESGASPYFVVAQNNTAELKKYSTTMLSQYYSIRYNIWVEDIVKTYHQLNNSLKDVRYSKVQSHQFLDKNNKIVKVTYDNGITFYINYLLTDYTAVDSNGNDIVIPAESFVKVDKKS